ncbi:enoyl-CoA hydratase/isomerase family protein [Roseiarcaceae bacterium H3SJ34-1]|uniref:enoyl-CoA hydratase/isomerase family protein n=1 Tax=Terripilifer ovatus TaxID=3032367 RepID=UPI003AB9A0EE|nr:enoyl-CoA hydratase/isomerase family protein [Roseiarcaceae bacterium H3SJ34-1]
MSDVIVARQGALGRLTLNRPRALNALTQDMVRTIHRALLDWRSDDGVIAVLIDGAGERGLCAGGDIRSIYDSARIGKFEADDFWREEYVLNAFIAHYPKPYIALMDGIVMGGGVGISSHGSHRIVTERTRLAMPEVGIGFVPDVGGTFLLSRALGELGAYAGLTASQISGADAMVCELADDHIRSDDLPEFVDVLAFCEDADHIDGIVAAHTSPPGESSLLRHRDDIDRCFAADKVEDILQALDQRQNEFCADAAKRMRRHSPTSLKVTLRALRQARALPDLEACLQMEYRVATACIRGHDMIEGIRAVVVDKDQSPKWQPARLADVREDIVQSFFGPPPGGDVQFSA